MQATNSLILRQRFGWPGKLGSEWNLLWCKREGDFQRGDLVDCLVEGNHRLVARGLVNYSAEETRKIAGHSSLKIEQHLGYVDEPELIHRDNMVLL